MINYRGRDKPTPWRGVRTDTDDTDRDPRHKATRRAPVCPTDKSRKSGRATVQAPTPMKPQGRTSKPGRKRTGSMRSAHTRPLSRHPGHQGQAERDQATWPRARPPEPPAGRPRQRRVHQQISKQMFGCLNISNKNNKDSPNVNLLYPQPTMGTTYLAIKRESL